jgi:NAD(P)-dependent dehydrogenase (short-subunit alcohol dehydrogenase family)
MELPKYKNALIVGAGEGLSASLARLFAREGIRVALAARQIEKLGALCTETGARAFACNATDAEEVERLFGLVEREIAAPDIVVYNASGRARALSPISCRPKSPIRSRPRLRRLPGGAGRQAHAAQRTARSCSPAPPPASRAIRNRPRLRWQLRCAAWRAWRANCRRRLTSRISSSTAVSAAGGNRARRPAGLMLDPDAIALSY